MTLEAAETLRTNTNWPHQSPLVVSARPQHTNHCGHYNLPSVNVGHLLTTHYAICRVRISLGLKPLSMENSADTKRKEFEARQKVQAEQEKDAQAAALAERVQK